MKPLYTFSFLIVLSLNATAQMKWRLVETVKQVSNFNSNGVLVMEDSINYTYDYSKDRKGMPGQVIEYSYMDRYTPNNVNVSYAHREQGFYSNNDRMYINYYNFDSLKGLVLTYIDSFVYKNGYLDELIKYKRKEDGSGEFYDHFKTRYGYDSSGNLTSEGIMGKAFFTQSYVVGDFKYYKYDTTNKLVVDSIREYTIHGPLCTKKHYYLYDTADNLIQKTKLTINNQLDYDTNYINYYSYENGLLVKDSSWYYDPNQPDYMHTYTYYNTGELHTDTFWHYNNTTNTYTAYQDTLYKYNQQGLLSEVLGESITNHYNRIHIQYKYEHYWPADVSETLSEPTGVSIHPNPASGIVNVHTNWKEAGQVNGTITDMQGRVLRRWTEHSVSTYDKHLNIHQLASGVYILHLTNNNEAISRQLIVR